MNPHGHHDCAEGVGEKELADALERAGKGKPRLAAFYLGNWLTDVSQAVDPVAYEAAANQVTGPVESIAAAIEGLFQELKAAAFAKVSEALGEIEDIPVLGEAVKVGAGWLVKSAPNIDVPGAIDEAKSGLLAILENVLQKARGGRQSELAQAFRTAFRVKGYFKFVHPKRAGDPSRMDFQSYLRVFDERYTQYYPHEHLDRPEILPSTRPQTFAGAVGNGTRSEHGKVSLTPDLYAYLRDDIEIAAGILARVDRDWASKYLKPGANPVDDGSDDWNMFLARLGYALHMVEDFFSHTIFIEHAATILGPKYQPKSYQDRAEEILNRRLKRFSTVTDASVEDPQSLPEERHVVSGYFDFQDTLISLSHLLEELFDLKTTGLGDQLAEIHEKIEEPDELAREFQKVFTDTMELVSDPERAISDDGNRVAKKLKDKYNATTEPFTAPFTNQIGRDIVGHEPIFQGVPDEVKDDFVNAVVLFNKTRKIAGTTMSLYSAVKTVREFFAGPLVWLKKFLVDLGYGWAADLVLHYAKEKVYDFIGQKRIGSHSLIAKDHGQEWLYEHQKNCAKAVHWYIIDAMARWSRPRPMQVSKAKCDAADDEECNTNEQRTWIDWLELLEYFLRHPATLTKSKLEEVEEVGTVRHVVRRDVVDSLANLARHYARTAAVPQFTWRTIADYNFDTKELSEGECQRVINAMLRDRGLGYRVSDGINYAYKPGVKVHIPHQKFRVKRWAAVSDAQAWYRDVMENKRWEVMRGWEDARRQKSMLPRRYHSVVWIKLDEVTALVNRAQTLRSEAEGRYVPG